MEEAVITSETSVSFDEPTRSNNALDGSEKVKYEAVTSSRCPAVQIVIR